jgi:hypothetical protein
MDQLQKDPRADITRCGVTGLSMGGCASFLIFAELPQIQAAVPMIGIPNFSQRWKDLLDECKFSNPEWAAALAQVELQTQEHTRFVKQMDPYSKLKAAATRALLIMNCDFDSDQPKIYSINAYRELLPYYQLDPGKIKLRIYPAGHQVTPDMEKNAVHWFCKHLITNHSQQN